MNKVDLPYIFRDADRNGNKRVYFRRHGRKTRLSAPEGSVEFLREYHDAANNQTKSAPRRRRKPPTGSVAEMVQKYRASRKFRDLSEKTKRVRERLLNRIIAKIGPYPAHEITRKNVKAWRDAPDAPEAGNAILKVLRQVLGFGLEEEMLEQNVAMSVPYRKGNPDGWAAWTMDDIQTFVKTHPKGTMAYKALCLFLFTGQRLGDVARLGPQHVKSGWLVLTQQNNSRRRDRTPVRIEIPIVKPLAEVLDDPKTGQAVFLTSSRGRPFASEQSLGNWFRKRAREAGVHKPVHGIRIGLGDILAAFGLTAHQIMAILGHSTLKQAEVYTRRADRRRLAEEGMRTFEAELNWNEIDPLSTRKT